MQRKGIVRIFYLLTVLFAICSVGPLHGQSNILRVIGSNSAFNEQTEIKVDIANDQSFISFQCDIVLPSSMSYVEESATLSERAKDHVLNVSEIQGNKVRLFAYSLNNKKFKGDSGTVAGFQVMSGNEEGSFELIVEKAIIGDSLSHNIITDSVNGIITVSPTGINDHQVESVFNFSIIPNPFINHFDVEIYLKEPAELYIELLTLNGKQLASKNLGRFEGGLHRFSGDKLFDPDTMSDGVALIRVFARGKDGRIVQETKKLVKTKP
ncbi:MAG: hypothetical protein K9H15_07545 [Bacteroidales bacterium]|nr:hypothetical protein [Bacteroidales bacterium]